MSYTRTYSASAHYEGSVYYSGSVHYPASQSGGSKSYSGTVHYSGSVPINVNIHVDTHPFDRSVSGCNSSVGTLGASVVALNAAQCNEIEENSKKVSASIIGGFFNLIRSELSQAMVSLVSKINSGIMLIKTHAERIASQQTVMDKDYNRLKAHYVGIFNELDKECQRRIVTLDKKAFALGINVLKKQYIAPFLQHVGNNYTYLFEEPITKNKIATARLKVKAVNIINVLADNITQDKVYSQTLNSVLNEENRNEITPIFIPAIHVEFDDIESGEDATHNYIPSTKNTNSFNTISSSIDEHFMQASDCWMLPEQSEIDKIDQAFNVLLDNVEDKRVAEMIVQLKASSKMKVN